MGIATSITVANKAIYREYLNALANPGDHAGATRRFHAANCDIQVVHPFNELGGCEGYLAGFLEPLQAAFRGCHRRDCIVMGGEFDDGEWVCSTGHYAGTFVNDWLGIPADQRLHYLRVGEFHRMLDGRAVESRVYLDIPELMIACGVWPIARSGGHDGFLPGPATGDGLLYSETDPAESAKSLQQVQDMLVRLNTPDKAWRPYWHANMAWYGPAAFGAYLGVADFEHFQVPFEACFEGWAGGSAPGNTLTRHFIRAGDGYYTCSGGWPSLTGVHVMRFLDQEPTGTRVFMRVCDWWRRDESLLVENWVFVDVPDLLRQLGTDVFAAGVVDRYR